MRDLRHPALLWVNDHSGNQIGPLHSLSEFEVSKKFNGAEGVSFSIKKNDPKSTWIVADRTVTFEGVEYRINRVIEGRSGDGFGAVMLVSADALWYDLGDDVRPGTFVITSKTVTDGLTDILDETGWTVGTIEGGTNVHSYELDNASVLELIKGWSLVAGLELEFDTQNKTVSLLDQLGETKAVGFRYGKNLDSIEKEYQAPVATRIWPFGGNDVGISSVNPTGLGYVEDYSWYVEQGMTLAEAKDKFLKERIWKDERFLLALSLYDAAVAQVAIDSRPKVSYKAEVADLSEITGIPESEFNVGDTVWVDDEELNVHLSTRVVSLIQRPNEPWANTVELSYLKQSLSISSLLSTSSNGGEGGFKLFVDENPDPALVAVSDNYLCEINVTVGGQANSVIGAHFVGLTTGTGTLHLRVAIDGIDIGGTAIIPFIAGQTISKGIPTWAAGLEEGSHDIALIGKVTDGSGVLSSAPFNSRLYVLVSGAVGGGVSGGGRISIEDTVPDGTDDSFTAEDVVVLIT